MMDEAAKTRAGAASLRVLLADDDPLFTEIARTNLKRCGWRVTIVGDGAEAMHALSKSTFDVAVLDLSMPRVDGFRLIATIRATPNLKTLPIAIVSGRADAEAVQSAYRLGANFCTSKPVNWQQFPVHLRKLTNTLEPAPTADDA